MHTTMSAGKRDMRIKFHYVLFYKPKFISRHICANSHVSNPDNLWPRHAYIPAPHLHVLRHGLDVLDDGAVARRVGQRH